jgi:hypothetical protein
MFKPKDHVKYPSTATLANVPQPETNENVQCGENTTCTHHGTLMALNCIFSHSHFSWKGLLATALSSV